MEPPTCRESSEHGIDNSNGNQHSTMPLTRQRQVYHSTRVLLLSNLATILFAVVQQWDVSVVMWIYWGQSVIIGYFNVRRMLALKQYSTENFRINNRPAEPTRKTQRQTAFFFAVHYGFFHFAYLVAY